jgi:hypothetical protein
LTVTPWSFISPSPSFNENATLARFDKIPNLQAKRTRDLHRELSHQRFMFRQSGGRQGMCDPLPFPGCLATVRALQRGDFPESQT